MMSVAAASLVVHVALMAVALVAARAPLVIPPSHEIAVDIVQEAPKSQAPKPQVAKPQSAEPKPAEPQAKPPAPTPAPLQAAKPPTPATAQSGESQLKAMREELARLRAEQDALKADVAQIPSGKALALPSIGGNDGDAVGYQQLVFSQLAKAKGDAEYHGQAGSTGVTFEIDETGKLVRVEITRSSGNPTLDGQALDIIHRAAPFPPPPTASDRIVFANVNFVPPKTK